MDFLSFIVPVAQAATEATHVAAEVATHAQDAGIAGTFGLNAKVFIAQLINFGIVVLVLWKWVLTPLAKRLEERQHRIAQGLKDAESTDLQKKDFEEWKKSEIRQVKTEAANIISIAKKDAEEVKKEILEKAKQEQERMIVQAKEEMHNEENKAVADIKKEIADLVIAATEKILKQKLNAATDKEMIKEAITEVLKKPKK